AKKEKQVIRFKKVVQKNKRKKVKRDE
ncbi:hypothetical protein C5S31_02105, partial [ANME-1 cluster archaeon GoMg2]|nr:hypothetical protein [ANME-1 cluster archaeon GoMg2]